MGDTTAIHAPHAQQWKRLYEAAILELDPAKLLQRIAAAKERFLTKWKTAFQNHRIANNSPCTTRYTC